MKNSKINDFIKIGITGQNGFIGSHLINNLLLYPKEFEIINFNRNFFNNEKSLDEFVLKCDVIIHLAALNRHDDPDEIFRINVSLVQCLINSLSRTKSRTHVIMASSTQEALDNPYGLSKKKCREMLLKWANSTKNKFTGLIIPNVFGPFGNPFYNSVVTTFCHQISNRQKPKINEDGILKLIYINDLVKKIIEIIRNYETKDLYKINHSYILKVSDLLKLIKSFYETYELNGEIPYLNSKFELDLFNTYRCHMNINDYFPVNFIKHNDKRGSFFEMIRFSDGGQVSFSTTEPGYVRGNHFHTRKIERFAVIKGKALIQLRRIGSDKILSFYLDGNSPSYVDIPIWFTHNIKNIGDELLYTNFWINEVYNPDDPDTFFEDV